MTDSSEREEEEKKILYHKEMSFIGSRAASSVNLMVIK